MGLYINKVTLRYLLQHYSSKLKFENYDRRTLICLCYLMLEEYRKLYILQNIKK